MQKHADEGNAVAQFQLGIAYQCVGMGIKARSGRSRFSISLRRKETH